MIPLIAIDPNFGAGIVESDLSTFVNYLKLLWRSSNLPKKHAYRRPSRRDDIYWRQIMADAIGMSVYSSHFGSIANIECGK